MANLGSYLPSPGSSVWRRDVGSPRSGLEPAGSGLAEASSRVRHVVIRNAEIWEEPAPYVVYRITVQSENDHWYLYRRYSQFHSLHKKLVKQYGVNKDLLPPKKISGNLSKQLIDKRRKLLEGYLQKIIHREAQVSQSPELQVFLDAPTHDVVKVTDILTRHLYHHGDQLLEASTPIALSVNEMYAITKRLQLPRDATGIDLADVTADPAHLYSFVHQLQRIRIGLPPFPASVTCTPFDLGPFRSLHTIKLERVPMSQVGGLVLIQQQLQRLSVHHTLRSLCELLVEGVQEKRSNSSSVSEDRQSSTDAVDGWRLAATAKLVGTRVVVQPWHRLHTLTLSHNLISHLDNSLQVLPALRELTLSYNKLETLSLQYLCLPSLEKLNLSHNQIHTIQDNRKVLERITHLSLAHNRLGSLEGIAAFVGVCVLNLAFNMLSSSQELSKLARLRRLNMLSMIGNPVSGSSDFRIILLAKLLRKSRMISVDGMEATPKEQAKIKSYVSKYGPDPDVWPMAKSRLPSRPNKPHPLPSSGESSGVGPGFTTPPTPTHVDLSWQIQSDHEPNEPHLSSGVSGAAPTGSRPSSARSGGPSWDRLSFPSSSNDSLDKSYGDSGRRSSGGGYGNFGTPQLPRGRTFGTPQFSRGHVKRPLSSSFSGTAVSEESYSTGVRLHGDVVDQGNRHHGDVVDQGPPGKGYTPRPEPDGQSDISSTSPDVVRQRHPVSPYRSAFSTPPCTPVPIADRAADLATPITPAMLQSALDALEAIQDKATPLTPRQHLVESGVLPEAVTSALTKWISSQSLQNTSGGPSHSSVKTTPLLTPPPSTPEATPLRNTSFEGLAADQGISAGDLIAALSTLKVSGEDRGSRGSASRGSGSRGSGGPSVPACTPNEGSGGIEEWAKLGIKPEAVIQALSALTIQQEEEEEEEEEEDGHRSCLQYRATPSPAPPEVPLPSPHPSPRLSPLPSPRLSPHPSPRLSPHPSPLPSPHPFPHPSPHLSPHPSPLPSPHPSPHPSPRLSPLPCPEASEPTPYLCLFPERRDTPPGENYTEETDEDYHLSDPASISHAHQAGHTHQPDNEFAELDPFLNRDAVAADFDPSDSSEPGELPAEEAEVGIDVAKETGGGVLAEESVSPMSIDSVLYSN